MKIGLIGTGEWAQTVHLPTLANYEGVELAGVWGRSAERAADTAARFNTIAFADVDALIDAVDVVSIVVSPAAQPMYAAAAAEAGRHLLLEKPTAADSQRARSLAETVARTGVQSVVFVTRFFDTHHRAWLDSQRAGGPSRASVSWRSGAMLPGSPFAGGWRDDADALLDVGPHFIGQFEYLLGPIMSARTERTVAKGASEFNFEHEDGRTSTAILDLHNPEVEEELYQVRTGRSVETRNVRLNSSVALVAALDQLRLDIRSAPAGSTPWSVEYAARTVEIISSLRDKGTWTARETRAA